MSSETDEHGEEDRWLETRERGEPLPPIPEAIAASHGRLWSLMKELPAVPADARPRPGWQDAVLQAIDRGDAELPSSERGDAELPPSDPEPQVRPIDSAPSKKKMISKRSAVIVAGFLALAAGVLFWVMSHKHTELAVALTIQAVPGETTLADRDDLRAGGTALVHGQIDGPGELRVYDSDDVERVRCSESGPGCKVDRDGRWTQLFLEVKLPLPGPVHVVLLSAPLPGPSGGRAADLAAADRAGITWKPLDKSVH
ncbi:MAG TPA: hypothetical protein VFK02_10690 [Kofleriaceae bacterium]|nr:hypothetical protein [Kofleriaceae bacterium]